MNNPNDEQFISDEQLMLLLDAKDAGKSFPDALLALGASLQNDDTKRLKAIWDMQGTLSGMAHTISPKRSTLTHILAELPQLVPDPVTTLRGAGYTEGAGQGPTFIRSIHNVMQINWKIAAPIAVVALAVVAVLSGGSNPGAPLATNTTAVQDAPEMAMMAKGDADVSTMAMKMAPAPVSGEVDDLAASLALEADGDLTLLSDMNADLTLVASDSQTINDYATAYDETTF